MLLRFAQPRVVTFLGAWYITSLITLFSNKLILSKYGGTANTLALTQMCSTCVYGALKVYNSKGSTSKEPRADSDKYFHRSMLAVGAMRFATVILGLVGLKYVPISFVETVKSSAPFFTVVFARILLHQRTRLMVNLSLIPVVVGLALCSATELSFHAVGFAAAVANNCVDCLQNVYSKKLLTGAYTYVELQFYTSAAALVCQAAVWLVWIAAGTFAVALPGTRELAALYALNGISYHLQSVFAYGSMQLLSPVTHSVCNTVKRALLIWLSVSVFHNPVAPLSGLGMLLVSGGVLLYTYAQQTTQQPTQPPQPQP